MYLDRNAVQQYLQMYWNENEIQLNCWRKYYEIFDIENWIWIEYLVD